MCIFCKYELVVELDDATVVAVVVHAAGVLSQGHHFAALDLALSPVV